MGAGLPHTSNARISIGMQIETGTLFRASCCTRRNGVSAMTGRPTDDQDAPAGAAMSSSSESVIPRVEETLHVEKRETVTGRVRVQTRVDLVEEVARASLDSEVVDVKRVAVDRVVTTPPEVRTEGDVTIIPVLEEILVVEKRLVLKEELHIRRSVSSEEVSVPVTLRKQRAVVEHLPGDDEDDPA